MKTIKQLIQQTYSWKLNQLAMVEKVLTTTLSTELFSDELSDIRIHLASAKDRIKSHMKQRLQQEELKQTQETLKKVNAILSKEENE